MQCYTCDWCGRHKNRAEHWTVGLAAEHVGTTARRREISIAERWSETMARHRLAVHFCCTDHAELYVDRLIFTEEPAGEPEENAAKPRKRHTAQPAVAVARERKKAAPAKASCRARKRVPKFDDQDVLRARSWGIQL